MRNRKLCVRVVGAERDGGGEGDGCRGASPPEVGRGLPLGKASMADVPGPRGGCQEISLTQSN